MTNIPNKVNPMGVGVAGQIAKGLHSYSMLFHGTAKDDSVCVGCFVQATDNEGIVKGASGNAIDHKILGVAIKDHYVSATKNTAIYAPNDLVTYLTKGVVYIETKSPAKVGQYVFLKNDNGTLVFDDTETKADHTFTGFKVVKGTGTAVNTATGFDIIAIISE